MDTKDITKGNAFVVEYAGIFNIQSTNYYEETSLLDIDCHIEAEANAELFKEAFNISNETGLSPIQMRDRIKELENLNEMKLAEHSLQRNKEILEECTKAKQRIDELDAILYLVRSNYRRFGRDSSNRLICRLEKEDVELIETALNNKQK